MALKTKYTTFSTGYEITLPDVAYATIHRVMRSGISLRRVVNIPPDSTPTFAYDYGSGKFTFGTIGSGQPEPLIITYYGGPDAPPEPPPGEVCTEPMGVGLVVNSNKSVTVTMPATGQYKLDIGLAPNGCGVSPIKSGTVNGGQSITTIPLAPGNYKACVKKLCGFYSESAYITIPFTIPAGVPPPPTPNGRIKNSHPDGVINSVSPVFYTLASGSFPIAAGASSRDIFHHGYTGALIVNVTKLSPFFPPFIKVRVAGVVVKCQPAVNGNNLISSVTFTEGQFFELEYTNTPC